MFLFRKTFIRIFFPAFANFLQKFLSATIFDSWTVRSTIFSDSNNKPITCAPHGLNKSNCISYSNYDDLMKKINILSDDDYKKLQENSIKWARANTTKSCAERVISIFNRYKASN